MSATAPFPVSKQSRSSFNVPLAAGALIYAGTMVALNAAGNAVSATDTAGLRVIGVAENTVDNTTGAAGDLRVTATPGVFQMLNKAVNSVVDATVGLTAFVSDNNTVCLAAGTANSIKAGIVQGVDADGVWVDFSAPYL